MVSAMVQISRLDMEKESNTQMVKEAFVSKGSETCEVRSMKKQGRKFHLKHILLPNPFSIQKTRVEVNEEVLRSLGNPFHIEATYRLPLAKEVVYDKYNNIFYDLIALQTYVVQLFEVTCEECNGVLKFVIKLDECELVKETKVERVTITLMNRALDESISANDPRNFSVQSENNIFLLATFKNNLQFRWSRSGLDCLHEATEDFLIVFFQDSYVMTAHAHRSTLMPRDFNSLRLLRFTYDKTLVPVGISDRKMDNILNIPPLGKVKVIDLSRIAHQYGTHLNVELESLRENEELDFQIEEERIATEQREHKMAEAHHEANAEALQCLYPFFDVGIFLWGRHHWFRFGHQEVTVLRVQNRELSDLIINFFLCFLVKNLPENVQDEVAVLDAQLLVVLYSGNTSLVDVVDWFQRVNMDTEKYFLLAYNEWSVQKLVTALEALTQEEIWEEQTISSCKVPKQEDDHSCGWMVLLNAELLLQRLYGEEQRSARSLAVYTNGHLE
ncbi:hypothetical protein L7F22_067102 [Adiantum nelumboides]|nr:hypothetical protein [Adiantum nelumboides]